MFFLKNKIKILLFLLILALLSITVKNIKKNYDIKSNQVEFLTDSLNIKKLQILNVQQKLLDKDISLEEIITNKGFKFYKTSKKKIKSKKKNYFLTEYSSSDLIYGKHPDASSSAYIDYFDDKFFLITATGNLSYVNIDDLNNDSIILMNKIKTNINEIIKYFAFYTQSTFGIKDLLIYEDNIYISYTNQLYKDCYNTSILVAKLSFENVKFDDFFEPSNCIKKNSKEFNAHQSGGRMFGKNQKIFFTTGEFRNRLLAQKEDNTFGKILSIDINTKDSEIISLGHRNPQGLIFHNNLLILSEHGPDGGDEINIIDMSKINKENIPNFGWPIASYGNHYFEKKNDPRLKSSPLFKSHKKYGYIEPIKYFVPSIGTSQIINVPKKFNNYKNNNQYFLGTLGNGKRIENGSLSLFHFELNDNNKISNEYFIKIHSRVRDLIYIEKINKVVMFLETNSSLGILSLKN
jgi:hypothetical protein|tara:strand:- start:149 stop:1537 length:1389 start_codon:yes stop_codon:yes gene_type:complete